MRLLAVFIVSFCLPAFVEAQKSHFALVLEDAPAVKQSRTGEKRNAPALIAARQTIEQKQAVLRKQVELLGSKVTGSTSTLLNAIYVIADRRDVAKLRGLPGVRYVAPLPRAHLYLDQAVQLIDAPNAWNLLGGTGGAGAGQKIAVIDTGIDQTHPAFQDSTLQPPSGYPICDTTANCAFTNSKVIVARSYVEVTAGIGDPGSSTPDDYSPRDRVGHGTAVAMCAGGNTNAGPLATITGLAPHAYLGNYKIFGSPGVNDGASGEAILMALDDAFNDGMDVVVLSSGFLPVVGPLDTGITCGLNGGEACDVEATAVENAVTSRNMVVVAAAGNDGEASPSTLITLNTISTPATAPDAIAVGATGNSRLFISAVEIGGPSVPSNLQKLQALYGNGPVPNGKLTAPLADASKVGDPLGCQAYPANSLQGAIALISRGICNFSDKVDNATGAGAVGVLMIDTQDSPALPYQGGLGNTTIPSFIISYGDGQNVKGYVDANSGATASLDPSLNSFPAPDRNQVTSFSSRGPAIGTYGIKPDVVAPGENIYMAAQNFDPNGVMYSGDRYIVESGTSFSAPITAGVAALVRQQHPDWTPVQVKSAIVNTATSDTSDPFFGASGTTPSGVLSVGGGKVEALSAVQTNLTAEPSTISFGALPSGFTTSSEAITLVNHGTGPLTLTMAATRTTADTATQLAIDTPNVTLAAGQSQSMHLTLSGTRPTPGRYEGSVQITGGAVPLHVPFLYLVGDGVPANVFAAAGDGDVGIVGQPNYIGGGFLRVLDQFGVPVANAGVTWAALDGGSIGLKDSTTDQNGVAGAETIMGPTAGNTYNFKATITGAGNQSYTFSDLAILQPTINTGGVVNAASFALGNGIAPGSIVSLFGTGLSDSIHPATTIPLPISLGGLVSVGFDAQGVHVPGALYYADATQVNVQVPWELAGQTTVQIKVNDEPITGVLTENIPVTTYSPAMFVVNGIAAAEDLNGVVISPSHPAARGQYVTVYCNGLGPVTNQPATGAPALANPLSVTVTQPTITIGGTAVTPQFSGLAPTFAGLYQLNLLVPADLATGSQPIVITIGGVASPAVNIPVQ